MTSRIWRLAALPLLAWSAQAGADLALSGHSVTASFGMPVSSQERIWIRNGSIRRDYSDRGRAYSQLIDLDKKQVVQADHFTRIAEIYDLAALEAGSSAAAPAVRLNLGFVPTGNTRPLQNWQCREHELTASMPARLGNEETVFHLKGRVWVASGVPEQAAIRVLAAAAKKKEFFLAAPGLAMMAPAQTRAMSEILRQLAFKGLPCAGEIEGSYEGNGPMVNLARKLPSRAAISFEQYSGAELDPQLFAIPAGYQQVKRQLPAQPMAALP